jgi:phage-related protein
MNYAEPDFKQIKPWGNIGDRKNDGYIRSKAKHLDDGIFELRAKVGSNSTRVLYFFFVGQRVVITNGFVKKTQKTPKAEIEKAKAYRESYKRREEINNENT